MDNNEQRDSVEERYNAELCPACTHSPCCGAGDKGSCMDDDGEREMSAYGLGY